LAGAEKPESSGLMPVLSDPRHDASDWFDDSLTLPKMDIYSRDHLPGPVGFIDFIDFERKRVKAENGRNATERRCQIRTVRLK
jgi:hypothetical protein